jgi:phenolic acid decarboxylase
MKSQDKLPTDAIVFEQDGIYRYPTRRECELMQNLSENYTKAVNYRVATGLLGNAWNKDTVKHILKNFGIKIKK